MSEMLGDSLDRARVMVDSVSEINSFKALDALYKSVELIYLEMIGQVAPAGAKMLSVAEAMAMVKTQVEKAVGEEEDEPTRKKLDKKTQDKLEKIRANSYL